jgi:iron-sulfur cluster repair protein YtfE (RIC family)
MSLTLPTSAHQHHAEILPHVEALRVLADDLAEPEPRDLPARLAAEVAFLREQLVPHMEMAETALYPRMEKLLGDVRAVEPLRREHGEVRHLVDELERVTPRLAVPMRAGQRIELRRALYRLFAILSVHLAEEEQYLAVLQGNLSDAELAELVSGMEHVRLTPM